MNKITLSTLKAGCEALGLEINSKKPKDLEKAIDEAIKNEELGYECPSCGKDIPDISNCYYCGENFDEDKQSEEEIDEEVDENEDGEEYYEEVNEDEEEVSANEFLNQEFEKTAKEVASKVANKPSKEDKKKDNKKDKEVKEDKKKDKEDKKDKDNKEAKKEVKKDKEVKEDKKKDKEVKEDENKQEKKGRLKLPEEVSAKRKEEFEKLITNTDKILGDEIEKRPRKTGVTYVNEKQRVMKIVSSGKEIILEFNVKIDSNVDGFIKYTEEEAKAKHLGKMTSMYNGNSFEDAISLIKKVKASI